MDVTALSALFASLRHAKELAVALSDGAKALKEVEIQASFVELDLKFSESMKLAAELKRELAERDQIIVEAISQLPKHDHHVY